MDSIYGWKSDFTWFYFSNQLFNSLGQYFVLMPATDHEQTLISMSSLTTAATAAVQLDIQSALSCDCKKANFSDFFFILK